jgi:hypothetical protein
MTNSIISNKKKAEEWSYLEAFLKKNLLPVSPSPVFIKGLQKQLTTDSQISLEESDQTGAYIYSLLAIIGGLLLVALWIRLLVPLISMRKMYFRPRTSVN